jgi:biotin synthase
MRRVDALPGLCHAEIAMNSLTTSVNFDELADISLRGGVLSHEQARAVLAADESQLDELLQATLRVREQYHGRRVKMCVLLNAQSGICPEDCHYCSQSKISTAKVDKYKLLPEDTITQRAQEAAASGAKRFCMVIAARGPQQRDIDRLCAAVRRIKSDEGTRHLELCASLGLMNVEQCRQLKEAGVDFANHNLNTSESHYEKICTTHTYADRVETLKNVRESGLQTCSGGIIGLGESDEDIIEMGLALRSMDIDSIPVNFLLSIDGTPLAGQEEVDPNRALKVLCLMRLLNPSKEVRVSAGRESLGDKQTLALYAANSLFVDGYLTTPGDPHKQVKEWIEGAGFEVEK